LSNVRTTRQCDSAGTHRSGLSGLDRRRKKRCCRGQRGIAYENLPCELAVVAARTARRAGSGRGKPLGLRASCHACGHKEVIRNASLLQGRPGYTRLMSLERQLRCRKCGARGKGSLDVDTGNRHASNSRLCFGANMRKSNPPAARSAARAGFGGAWRNRRGAPRATRSWPATKASAASGMTSRGRNRRPG